jgi:hypothetical protein
MGSFAGGSQKPAVCARIGLVDGRITPADGGFA